MTVSFAQAEKTSVAAPKVVQNTNDAPFDPNLNFNRIIQPAGGKNKFPTRSIDSTAILKKLGGDKIDELMKITLACTYTRNDLMMWDAVANLVNSVGMTSCIFLASNDYNPIPSNRTVSSAPFLNFDLPGARLRLNKISVGDKVGIGIYNSLKRTSFVLLYEVMGTCVTQDPDERKEERPTLIHGINCELLKVYRLNENGEGDCLTIRKDDDTDVAHTLQTFVGYLLGTVMDITNAYPWKGHFVPTKVGAWDRDVIEARLKTEYSKVESSSYDSFEEACRDMYNGIRREKIDGAPRRDRRFPIKNKRPEIQVDRPKNPEVPVVEAVTLNDSDQVLIKLLNPNNGSESLFRFDKISMVDSIVTETFLSNADIEGTNLIDNSDILLLNSEVFGEEAIVRYFSVNF